MNRKFLLLSLSCLGACTVGPAYERPEIASDEQIAAALRLDPSAQIQISPFWYRDFQDPKLNRLIEISIADSPTVHAVVHKLHEARLALSISNVAYLPTVDIAAGYTKAKPSKNVSYAYKESYYQAGLDATWELDLWGAGRRKTESAEATLKAAEATLDNVILMLKAEIATAYISLRSAQEQLRLLQKTLILQESIIALATDQAAAGLISYADLQSARLATDQIKAQIPPLEIALDSYRTSLSVLAGKLPGQIDSLLAVENDNLLSSPFFCDLSALYNIPAAIVRNRPDVRIAEQNLIASNADIGQAVAALYPNINLAGFFGFQADNLPKLPNHKSTFMGLTPGLTLPLFHWNALMNNVAMTQEATKAQAEVYRGTVLKAVGEIRDSMTQVNRNYVLLQTDRQATEKRQDISLLTLNQYNAGLVSLSSALAEFQRLLAAQTTEVSDKAAVYQSVVTFYKSLGS